MWLKDLLTRAAIKQSRAEQDVVLFMRKHKGQLIYTWKGVWK